MKKNKIIYYLPVTIIVLLFVIITCLVIIRPINETERNYDELQSPFFGTNYDYIIYSPSVDQVDSIKLRPDVVSVLPYYKIRMDYVNYSGDLMVIMLEDINDLNKTEFSDKRIISKSSKIYDLGIAIDLYTSQHLGVTIDNEINLDYGLGTQTFTVTAIYENDNNFSSEIGFIEYSGVLKSEINSIFKTNGVYLAYEGAYIETNNLVSFNTFLKNEYKPWGLVWPEEYYNSHFKYQAQYDFVSSGNYDSYNYDKESNFLTFKTEILDLEQKITDKNKLLFYINIVFLIVLFFTIIYTKKSDIEKTVKQGKLAKSIFKGFIIEEVVAVLFIALILSCFYSNYSSVYYSVSKVNIWHTLLFPSLIILIFMIIFTTMYVYFVLIRKVKKQTKELEQKKRTIEKGNDKDKIKKLAIINKNLKDLKSKK